MSFKEWREVALEDVVDVLGDGLHGTPKYDEFGEYYFINGNNLSGKIVINDKTKRVNIEEYEKHKKPLNERTIFVSINGTLGNVAEYNGEKVMLGKSACYFNVKNAYNKDYVKYIMHSPLFKSYLKTHSTGTTIKNMGLKQMRAFQFMMPPIEEQLSISKILSDIDEKIEINNQINKNLEEMAQAIFKHWFVDFEFPNEEGKPYKSSGGEMVESELGLIPEGWEVKELKDISKEIVTGKTPRTKVKENYGSDIPFVKIPDMHGNVYITKTESYLSEQGVHQNKIIPKNSIIVSCIATPGLVSIASENCQTNQQINSLVLNDEKMCYFAYFALNELSEYIRILGSTGSATLNLNKSEFSKIKIIVPQIDVVIKYYKYVKSNFEMILENKRTNGFLETIRDTLLPKLMSGEIRVPIESESDAS